jgi:hypothetical protein
MRRTNSLTQQRTVLTSKSVNKLPEKSPSIDHNRRLSRNILPEVKRESNRESNRESLSESNNETSFESSKELLYRLEKLESSTVMNENIIKKLDEIGDKINDSILGSRELVNSLVIEHRDIKSILNNMQTSINIITNHTPTRDLEIQIEIRDILESIKDAVLEVSNKNQKVIDSVNSLNETFSSCFNIPIHRMDQISESHEQFILEIKKLYNTYTETHKLSESNTKYLGDIQEQLHDLITIIKTLNEYNINKYVDTSELTKLKVLQQSQFYKFSKIIFMYQEFVSKMYTNDNNKELNELSNIITDFTNNFSIDETVDYTPLKFD